MRWAGIPEFTRPATGEQPAPADEDRVNLLLANLEEVPWEQRTARFRCFIAICRPGGVEVSVVGSVAGMIQYEPQGAEGFGYDPVFYLPSFARTIAQLPLEEKNRISHRADAVNRAVAALERLLAANGNRQLEVLCHFPEPIP